MKFLIKIFPLTILIISLSLLTWVFYKSEIHWSGDKREYYLVYYLICVISILFSIILFFTNQKIKEYLIISFLSLILSLYFFEGYLTIKRQILERSLLDEKILSHKLYQKQTGKRWDDRQMLGVYTDMKKTNKDIVVNVFPNNYINSDYSIFPLSGISNSLTVGCNENGYHRIFESDRYGFNNPDNEWNQKNIEYLLVGDSFTHGACLNRPYDISSVLRTLSKKSVLNLGQVGNGPLIEYATLREYLNTKVKKVLWIYWEGNDLIDLKREKKNDILKKYLSDQNFNQNLRFRQNEIDNVAKKIMTKKEKDAKKEKNLNTKLVQFLKIYSTRYLVLSGELDLASDLEFKTLFQLVKKKVEKNNSKLYFIYLPEIARYKNNYNNKNYQLIKEVVTGMDIPFIDIHKEVFEKEEYPLKLFPFEMYGHYNIEGYKKVAEVIFKLTK